jgi:beta-N-acetylglucosaminidase
MKEKLSTEGLINFDASHYAELTDGSTTLTIRWHPYQPSSWYYADDHSGSDPVYRLPKGYKIIKDTE